MNDQPRDDTRPKIAHFELTFSPNLQLISVVRRFVSDFYSSVTRDAEVSSRLELTTHELLENAVKFSTDGITTLQVHIGSAGTNEIVTVTTRNRAAADHVSHLRELVSEVNAAKDPFQHYQTLMRRTAHRTEGSGLGIGRIVAEADMKVSCEVDQEMVVVRAVSRLPEATS